MKIKFGFKPRQTAYVTVLACAASLWMLSARFDVSAQKMFSYLLICLGFVVVIIATGAVLAFIYRFFANSSQQEK